MHIFVIKLGTWNSRKWVAARMINDPGNIEILQDKGRRNGGSNSIISLFVEKQTWRSPLYNTTLFGPKTQEFQGSHACQGMYS
jgi:hypothetical protein